MTVCEQGDTEQVQTVVFKVAGDFDTAAATNAFQGAANNGGFSRTEGAVALRFKSYANEVFYTSATANPFSLANPTDATALAASSTSLEASLEAIPNFRIRNVDVDDAVVVTSTAEITSTFAVTFRHEGATDNSFGEQNLLMCPHPRKVANDLFTFGCASSGCSPVIQQPRVALYTKQDSVAPQDANAMVAGADTSLFFTSDSVLTCPVGMTCAAATATAHQGAIGVYFEAFTNLAIASGTANDWKIYAKGFGAATVALDQTALLGAATTFTYIGRFSDYGTVGSTIIVDISAIMPDTRISVDGANTNALPTIDDNERVTHLAYFTTATCEGVTDTTMVADSFNNLDVENIECSGRGECDRGSGVCACFDGYTGLTCGEQTILI
jgi:hypothetical protein